MKCPKCRHVYKITACVKGGKKGGSAKVKKGFACKAVMDKALKTRKEKAKC